MTPAKHSSVQITFQCCCSSWGCFACSLWLISLPNNLLVAIAMHGLGSEPLSSDAQNAAAQQLRHSSVLTVSRQLRLPCILPAMRARPILHMLEGSRGPSEALPLSGQTQSMLLRGSRSSLASSMWCPLDPFCWWLNPFTAPARPASASSQCRTASCTRTNSWSGPTQEHRCSEVLWCEDDQSSRQGNLLHPLRASQHHGPTLMVWSRPTHARLRRME